jgi:hypothetical protein
LIVTDPADANSAAPASAASVFGLGSSDEEEEGIFAFFLFPLRNVDRKKWKFIHFFENKKKHFQALSSDIFPPPFSLSLSLSLSEKK